MKKNGLPSTAPLKGDAAPMRSAIATLLAQRIRFDRPSLYQLKIGEWNFYPSKGTIIRDGQEESEDERGLDAFIAKATAGKTSRRADGDDIVVYEHGSWPGSTVG